MLTESAFDFIIEVCGDELDGYVTYHLISAYEQQISHNDDGNQPRAGDDPAFLVTFSHQGLRHLIKVLLQYAVDAPQQRTREDAHEIAVSLADCYDNNVMALH